MAIAHLLPGLRYPSVAGGVEVESLSQMRLLNYSIQYDFGDIQCVGIGPDGIGYPEYSRAARSALAVMGRLIRKLATLIEPRDGVDQRT